MNTQWLMIGALVAYAAYVFWPSIKKLIPSLPKMNLTGPPSSASDFEAFEQLQRRALKLNSDEAMKCLQSALVPLFGTPPKEEADA